MKAAFWLLALVGMASAANAQSFNSFQPGVLSGVGVTASANSLTLTLGSNPTLLYNSVLYDVESVFGVWSLDSSGDFAAAGNDQGVWKYHDNYAGVGGIAGWKTQNANQGVTAGQSMSFTYTSLTGLREDFGYHVRLTSNLPGGANTLFVKNAPVPEPASASVLALGAAALLRRRRMR